MRRASFLAGVLGLVGGLLLWYGEVPPTPAPKQVAKSYGRLPLSFEANRGQTDEQVKFLSRGRGYTLFLTPTEAVLALKRPKGQESSSSLSGRGALHPPETNPKLGAGHSEPNAVLRMKLVGANPEAEVVGREELPGKSNYFIGNDPSKWRTNVPHYAKVKYEDVYPGIDLVYYGTNQGQLEYDFIVAPGADPKAITLKFEGADRLEVDAQGNLLLRLLDGKVRFHKPLIYQDVSGARREIAGNYMLKNLNEVAFAVASYDATRPLIIDPVLGYSTYLGGSSFEIGRAIAVDSAGSAYVTGSTTSSVAPFFPTTPGSVQTTIGGSTDAFVTKFSPDGSGLVYSTYLGGSEFDEGLGIAVDATGNAYVTGFARSTDFPITLGAFQTDNVQGGSTCGQNCDDAFVTKLNADGTALVYSTYLGGNDADVGFGISVDASGNAYVTGETKSSFPTTPGAFMTVEANVPDAFLTKLNPDGTALVYSTYLGGIRPDSARDIAVDANGSAYVTGVTSSENFPTTPGAFQTTFGGLFEDAFVTKFTPDGSALVYSTYLGGSTAPDTSRGDQGSAIAVDANGNAYIAGRTGSDDFPVVNPLQSANAGSFDAFVAKLNAAGSALIYSTYLGGSRDDASSGVSLAVDNLGNAYIAGRACSDDFPTEKSFQATCSLDCDAFVTKFNATGSALLFSTCFGGSQDEEPSGDIAVDASGTAYVTGTTRSTDFPTANPLQPANAGSGDAFIAKLCGATLEPTSLTFAEQIVSSSSAEQNITLTNLGAAPLTITSVVPSGDFAQGNTCAGPLAVGGSCAIGVIFTPTVSGLGTGEVTITDDACGNPYTVPLSGTGVDFALSVSPASVTVAAGQSATYTVTLTPEGGSFDNPISLSCSNLPSLSSCSFSPSSVTPGASDATSTLTVSTTAPASVGPGLRFGPPPRTPVGVLWLGVLALALLGLTLARRAARQQLRFGLALGLLAGLLMVQVACGGGGETAPSPPPPRPGTPTGTFNITITGTAGSLQHSTTATLVVQ